MGPLKRIGSLRGFTLLELLVVLVILGIVLGVVSISAAPNERQAMQSDAQRIALLLQVARDEAIVRNRPIALELGPDAYRFLVRDDAGWVAIAGDGVLRERPFSRTPMTFSIDPPVARQGDRLRIVFGRESVDKAFLLTLVAGELAVSIRADGIGHFGLE